VRRLLGCVSGLCGGLRLETSVPAAIERTIPCADTAQGASAPQGSHPACRRPNTRTWLWLDIVIVGGSIALALALDATTLRRRTA
jgi:hypothetical protein